MTPIPIPVPAAPAASAVALRTTRLAGVLASGLLAGAVLLVWVLDVELGRSAELYLGYRQATTAVLTALLPPLGGVALLAAAGQVLLDRGTGRAVAAAATALLVVGLLLTLAVLFPINEQVLGWTAPPADWTQVRDRWRAAHAVRSVTTLAAFVLLAGRLRRPA